MQMVVYVGDKIKHLRDARALTQEELATKVGIHRGSPLAH